MTFGIQPVNQALGMGGLAYLTPVALNPDAGLANAAGIPLVHVANARNPSLTHPWTVNELQAAAVRLDTAKRHDEAMAEFQADFQSVSSEVDSSDAVFFSAFVPESMDLDSVDVIDSLPTVPLGGRYDAPRVAQPVLCPSALATLHRCASVQPVNPRAVSLEGRYHPVIMPDGRSERAQVCRDIVNGSLLGTDGRNGTVPFEPSRADVTKAVADTARRWTGKPGLSGKKEWTMACLKNELPADFITALNGRLHAGSRLLPPSESTEWMIRVGFADGMPMHQALVRGDLPANVGLGTAEWARLALGIEQLGESHWEARHTKVMDAAAMPATNTKAFTALATSMSLLPAHIATERLRNVLKMLGVPTLPAEPTNEPLRAV
ncbi:hypothetical protein [Pandoraea sp. NPDC087047]|uniref:hypothetical protein n=1 Tax=Pandoraea sp. NPDC087047 TaxID=3364390 RepID=UPI00381C8242